MFSTHYFFNVTLPVTFLPSSMASLHHIGLRMIPLDYPYIYKNKQDNDSKITKMKY